MHRPCIADCWVAVATPASAATIPLPTDTAECTEPPEEATIALPPTASQAGYGEPPEQAPTA